MEEGLTDFAVSESVICDHLVLGARAGHQETDMQGGGRGGRDWEQV